MGYRVKQTKSEGGNARGHSRMAHWYPTAEVKANARHARRVNAKAACRAAMGR